VIVPGGFGKRGIEGKIQACLWCRKTQKPFLGICLGLQVATIEFVRNVLHWDNANSTEINPDTKWPVVIDMPEHNQGQMGGTMRLGKRETVFTSDQSVVSKCLSNFHLFLSTLRKYVHFFQ
jgi:CTP synthase